MSLEPGARCCSMSWNSCACIASNAGVKLSIPTIIVMIGTAASRLDRVSCAAFCERLLCLNLVIVKYP